MIFALPKPPNPFELWTANSQSDSLHIPDLQVRKYQQDDLWMKRKREHMILKGEMCT